MKKVTVVEIENSLLNFFTPAVIVPITYFLFNLVAWALLFLNWLIMELKIQIDTSYLGSFLTIFSTFVIGLLVLFIFIPRLKILDADFKEVNLAGILILLSSFCVVILFLTIINTAIDIYEIKIDLLPDYMYYYFQVQKNPFFLLMFFFDNLLAYPLFTELIYRRTMIPLLEDRGLSPKFAVIIASIGHCMINIPSYLIMPDPTHNIYIFITTFIFGLFSGSIYIFTRNIKLSLVFAAMFNVVYNLNFMIPFIQNSLLKSVYNVSISFLAFIAGFIIINLLINVMKKLDYYEWVETLKKTSAPNIGRGMIGFFIISLGLLLLQTIVVKIGREITAQLFPDYFLYISIFYFIAFTIPFWLTISSEYVSD
jgi:membrane protease YdiL (CAAX protease family)